MRSAPNDGSFLHSPVANTPFVGGSGQAFNFFTGFPPPVALSPDIFSFRLHGRDYLLLDVKNVTKVLVRAGVLCRSISGLILGQNTFGPSSPF